MDQDTFLTPLYVMIDDFYQSAGLAENHGPGPAASLSCSEVVTLAVFGQWARFPRERAFYRYAQRHLRGVSQAAGAPAVQSPATGLSRGHRGLCLVPGRADAGAAVPG